MTPVTNMTDDQFGRFVLDILQREIGPDGLARFLRLYCSGKGDYTRDRHAWQDALTVEEILASLPSTPDAKQSSHPQS